MRDSKTAAPNKRYEKTTRKTQPGKGVLPPFPGWVYALSGFWQPWRLLQAAGECPSRGWGPGRDSSLPRQQDPFPESLSRLSPAPGPGQQNPLQRALPAAAPPLIPPARSIPCGKKGAWGARPPDWPIACSPGRPAPYRMRTRTTGARPESFSPKGPATGPVTSSMV